MTVKTRNDMFHVVDGKETKKMTVACDFMDRKDGKVCGFNDRKEGIMDKEGNWACVKKLV